MTTLSATTKSLIFLVCFRTEMGSRLFLQCSDWNVSRMYKCARSRKEERIKELWVVCGQERIRMSSYSLDVVYIGSSGATLLVGAW